MNQVTTRVIEAVRLDAREVKSIVDDIVKRSPRARSGQHELTLDPAGRQELSGMDVGGVEFQVAAFFKRHDPRVKSVKLHQGFRRIAGPKSIRIDITLHPSK